MKNWLEIDRQNVWHPFTSLLAEDPILIERAQGVWLYREDGDKILDAVSSWWVNNLGHANPKIAQAIAKQAIKMEHVIFAGFTHKPAIKLTQQLLDLLPDEQSRVFFSDDGSTSVEVALKLAIQYWHNMSRKRTKVIAIEGAYHGDTFGAMSAADRNVFNEPFAEHLFDVQFIPFPAGDGQEAIQKMREIVDDATAAFIYEPLVQGAAGMRMYQPEVLDELIGIARSREVVCIADEVMTGFGRTGEMFASNYLTQKPDIFCLSKGITGGFLPLGLTVANKRIESAFDNDDKLKTFYHGHSYTANPISCAAANATLKQLTKKKVKDKIEAINTAHVKFVSEIESLAVVKEARVRGTILAVELEADSSGYHSNIRDEIYKYFLSRNILLRPLGNVIYILPPFVIRKSELRMIHQEIKTFLESMS
ncbi:MAG: adenosylmethionine--8-amino-7-oxononanoate transaminase [Cyclobacteriaceae bacterium]